MLEPGEKERLRVMVVSALHSWLGAVNPVYDEGILVGGKRETDMSCQEKGRKRAKSGNAISFPVTDFARIMLTILQSKQCYFQTSSCWSPRFWLMFVCECLWFGVSLNVLGIFVSWKALLSLEHKEGNFCCTQVSHIFESAFGFTPGTPMIFSPSSSSCSRSSYAIRALDMSLLTGEREMRVVWRLKWLECQRRGMKQREREELAWVKAWHEKHEKQKRIREREGKEKRTAASF